MVRTNHITLKYGAVFLLLCISTIAKSQSLDDKVVLSKSQVKISFSALMYDKLKIEDYGEKIIKSSYLPSFETSFSYNFNFKNGFGLNFGFGVSFVPHNINYDFSSSLTNVSLNINNHKLNHVDYIFLIGETPISIQKKFSINNKINKFFILETGIKLNFIINSPSYVMSTAYIIDNNFEDFFYFELDNSRYFLESYFIKIGLLHFTPSRNAISYNLVFNFSQKEVGKGYYHFNFLPFQSYGSVEQKINFIGFEFTYGISLK